MLTHLSIKDFAIIDEVEVALAPGLTALTGETGAGKSILLDALSLVLGDRADSGAVRHGAERADIAALFETREVGPAAAWLAEHELDADGECLLRRIVGRDGRSKGYINGRPAPLQSLRELGELLVDIHGQHEHQSLLRAGVQRELLDGFGGHEALLSATGACYAAWQALAERAAALGEAVAQRDERIDLLRYQAGELRSLDLKPGELDELEARHARLAHAGHIGTTLDALAEELLEGEQSVHDRLSRVQARLGEILVHDPGLAGLAELLQGATIQVDEAAGAAREALARIELDPQALEELDRRLAAVHELARKHRVQPQALAGFAADLEAELSRLEQAGSELERLEVEREQALGAYRDAAARLGKARRKAARQLSAAVSEAMHTLGMPGGQFRVAVTSDGSRPSPGGDESAVFEVSANPGQPPQALRRVASGGELSRISLAIQLCTSRAAHIPTLIFDEVDAGIGGATAEIVGQKLAALGAQRQALCVTHLPQVAAQAHHHLQVSKIAGARSARTRVRELSHAERIEEIARMLGGVEVTPQSLEHARTMVGTAGA